MKRLILTLFIFYLPFQLKIPQTPILDLTDIFLILLFFILVASRNKLTTKPKFETPLIMFIIIWFLSFLHTLLTPGWLWLWQVTVEFKRIFSLILAYFVFSRVLKTKKDVNFYFLMFLASISLASFYTLKSGNLSGVHFADFKRSSGPFGINYKGSDIAGGFIATFTPFLIVYFFFAKKMITKSISIIAFIICVAGLFATYSRGSIMALGLACVITLLISAKQITKQSKFNVAVIIIIILSTLVFGKRFIPSTISHRWEGTVKEENAGGSNALDESSQKRLTIWQSGLDLFKNNALTGIGFKRPQFELGVDTHNSFILIGAEMGIFGIFAFLWMLFNIIREAKSLSNTEFNYIGTGFIGCIIALVVVNMFYSNFFRDTVVGTFWVALGILASAKRISKQNSIKTTKAKKSSRIKLSAAAIVLFLLVLLNFTKVFAQADKDWWNQEEVKNLSVLRDFKSGMIGLDLYVDSKTGNDSGNGTILSPWKTIRKGIANLNPGDRLVVASGLYRERLFIKKSGTEDNRITIGPKGDGEVVIDCSDEVTGWTPYKKGIYKATCKLKPTAVVVEDKPFFPESSLSAMDESEWYYDKNTKLIYIYISNGEDPASHDIGVISNDEYQDGVLLNDASNITLYGLTVRYAGGRGISILGRNNRVEKCNVRFNGGTGINVFNYKNIVSDNTQIIKNNIYHNFLRNWPRGRYKWGSWGSGAGSQGTPNTQYIGNISHKNGGEGLLAYGGTGGTIFKDNIVYDNWSVNIYVDNQPNSIIDRNLIFCREPNGEELHNNGDTETKDGKNMRRLRAEGIMTADEKYGLTPPANLSKITITNNIIIGCRRGITHYGQAQGSGLKNVLIANNTIIVPDAQGIGEDFIGINVPYNNGNNTNTVYVNNIVFASHPSTYLLNVETGLNGDFHGVAFRNNLYFHRNKKRPFHSGPKFLNIYDTDFTGWQKKCSAGKYCSGELYSDPLFINAKEYSAEGLKLQSGSPAIDAGIKINGPLTDYYNNKRSEESPTIGAIEFIKSNE